MADFDDAERNALQEVEPADQLRWLLEGVDDDLVFAGLCILLWVPLMVGADSPETIRRWRELAMRQPQLILRCNYAVLALVFAEMAGRKQLWETELEGFDMQESTVIRGWREEGKKMGKDEGIKEGELKTARAAVVHVLQTRFPGTPVPDGVRSALEKNSNIRQLTDWHREAILTPSPADFERLLGVPSN